MHANEQTLYVDYAVNSIYINRKQNKNEANFALGKHQNRTSEFFHLNIGTSDIGNFKRIA